MSSLPEMLALRPIMEQVGVQFDIIANYEPSWAIQDIELGSTAASLAS